MIKRLGGLLYGSIPAEFKSAFGLAESAERLRAAARPASATSPSTVIAAPVVLRITALVLFFVAVIGTDGCPSCLH